MSKKVNREFFKLKPGFVSRLGLGCMRLPATSAESLIEAAYHNGIRLFDTADIYGAQKGQAEIILGRALQKLLLKGVPRTELIIATKCGVVLEDGRMDYNGSADYIHKSITSSLQRLQLSYIDIFYLHRIDPRTPLRESLQAIQKAVDIGWVKSIGISEVSIEEVKEAQRICPIGWVQNEYSFWSRDSEDLIKYCGQQGIMFVAYSPLGRAFFTEKADYNFFENLPNFDFRKVLPRYNGPNLAHNWKKREFIARMAQQEGCDLANLCLAWILSKGPHIVPIPGTTQEKHLLCDLKADFLSLSPETVAALDKYCQPDVFQGVRYPAPEEMASRAGRFVAEQSN